MIGIGKAFNVYTIHNTSYKLQLRFAVKLLNRFLFLKHVLIQTYRRNQVWLEQVKNIYRH